MDHVATDGATVADGVASRVDALDGLRGLLALVVVLAHACEQLYPAMSGHGVRHFGLDRYVSRSPLAVFVSADFAVRIFFVHSGFVLALKFFRSRDARWPVLMFLRRPLRLGLPVFVSMVFAWLLVATFGEPARELALEAGLQGSRRAVSLPPFGGVLLDGIYRTALLGRSAVAGAWWTMPVELYCSMALLALLAVSPRCRSWTRGVGLALYIAALLAVVARHKAAPQLSYGTMENSLRLIVLLSFSFVLGAWIAYEWTRTDQRLRNWACSHARLAWLLVGGALLVGVFPSSVHPFDMGYRSLTQLAFQLAAAIAVTGVLFAPRVQAVLCRPLVRWFGKISFSVYLIHLATQRTIMARVFLALRKHVEYNVAAVTAIVAMFAAVFVLAQLLTMTAERAALTWGKRALYKSLGLA